jgi:hypothetical protein
MDLSVGPDIPEKRKICCPYRQSNANPATVASFWDKITRELRRLYG